MECVIGIVLQKNGNVIIVHNYIVLLVSNMSGVLNILLPCHCDFGINIVEYINIIYL
jgi:hypothetical protein